MFVSVLMVRVLLDACRQQGIAVEQVLAGTGLTEELLSNGNHRVPAADFERLAERSLRLTQDPALGLSLGTHLPAQALQVVGYLLSSAPSLRQAYADFQRYAALIADPPLWDMHEEGSSAHFEFRCVVPHPHTQRMANDWSLSLAFRLIRACANGARANDMSVAFSHPKPNDIAPYQLLFGRVVRFGQSRNLITFPRTWLDVPQPHGDAGTCEGLREMAERILASIGSQRRMSDQLRLMLRSESRLAQIDVAELARRSGLSESTLRRRLASEGVSPSQLIDEARCRVACAELSRMDHSVKQLADKLGYAELSSFHRAFKRWTGKTPAGYRASVV